MDQQETHPAANNAEPLSETPPPPQIPWERFKYIGYIRAYWRTTRMVMTTPSQLEQFLDLPVCEKYAKKFRGFVFQIAAFLVISVRLFAILVASKTPYQSAVSIEHPVFANLLGGMLSLAGLFLATRSLEWFSRPGGFDPVRRARALSLSCYMCAPILIVAIIGAIVSLVTTIRWAEQGNPQAIIQVVDVAWLAIFMAWYPTAVRGLYFTTGRNIKRTIISVLALPVIWALQQLLFRSIPLSFAIWWNMAWSFL